MVVDHRTPVIARAARAGFVIGATVGAIEPLVVGIRKLVFGRLVFVGPDFWWLAPLVTAVLAAIAAVTAVAGATLVRPRWAGRAEVSAPMVLAAGSALLVVPGLHYAAAWLAALGIGLQAGRWLEPRRAAFERVASRAWGALIAVPLLIGVAIRVAPAASAAPVPAAGPDRPNILLVVLDTVRPYELSAYGFEHDTTPFLKTLAQRGTRFAQAFSVSPWTGPGHAGMFTGRWADELSVDWMIPLDRRFPTLAEALDGLGYRSGAVVANTEYASREVLGAGFEFFSDYRLTPGRLTTVTALEQWLWGRSLPQVWTRRYDSPNRVRAPEVTREFLDWLDGEPADRPFFAFLNYFDAHAPYFSPRAHWDRFVPSGADYRPMQLPARKDWTPEEVERLRRGYLASLSYLDEQLQNLFVDLERRGVLTNTLVIVTADHGEEFHEHGVMGHANSLHVQGLEVPLIVVWPGQVPAGRVVTRPVSTRQIPATIWEILGQPVVFPGPSLAAAWRSVGDGSLISDELFRFEVRFAPGLPDSYPVSEGPLSAILQAGFWHLISAEGSERLYDALDDPLQRHDLAADDRYRAVLARMRAAHEGVAPMRNRTR